MARRYDLLDDVNPKKETWKIKVMIVRLWNMPNYNNVDSINSIEMMILDEKGCRIQASVKRALINKFSSTLKEGKVFMITNFGVGQNVGSSKTTTHPYKINFHYSTSLRELEDDQIGLFGFSFILFDHINSGCADDSFLVDVIGELTAVGNLDCINNNGKQTNRLSIELTDINKKILSCTLWGAFADQISNAMKEGIQSPIIIVLQFGKIKMWRGTASLSFILYCTKLYFNENISDIVDFKNSLDLGDKPSQMPSQLNSQSSYSIADDFLQLTERKTLDDLREINEECTCIVLATILCIETDYNWFYNSCKKCWKKVTPDAGKNWCDKCCEYVRFAIPRYKVQLRVMDDSGSASFVIFDREANQVLEKPASELRAQLVKDGEGERFPDELNALVDRKFLFKIQISSYNLKENRGTYTVIRMSDDEKLIEAYVSISKAVQDQSTSYVGLDSQVDINEKQSLQESVSDACDNEAVNCLTPSTKRHIEVALDDHEEVTLTEDVQMSSTKKMKPTIKVEKDSS